MAFTAINTGAQGILYYQYSTTNAEHWAALQRSGAELVTLSPVLLLPPTNGRVSTSHPRIVVSLREDRTAGVEAWYLIAANIAHQTPAVARHYPGVSLSGVRLSLQVLEAGVAELIGGAGTGSAQPGRKVSVAGGVLTDTFDPFAVHVDRIVRAPARK